MKKDLLALVAATLALAAAALLAGCDGATPYASISEAESATSIRFNADWTIDRSGPLVSGSIATLHYAPERLPNCRTIYHGGPAWGIVAYWNADGGFARTAPVVQFDNGANVPVDATVRVPFGHNLAVWFFNSDVGGCQAWDSNYGHNFNFNIQPPPEPWIQFRADWSLQQPQPLHAGQDFLVDYNLIRSPTCRGQYNGYQTWEILAHARFSDGTTADVPVTEVVGLNGRDAAPARFHAPAGARSVELWFENNDRYGCHAWDSNYGHNYRFDVN